MVNAKEVRAIAVDGGGTHCRVALLDGEGIHTVTSGPANATSDIQGCARSINKGLQELSAMCNISLDVLGQTPAYLGLAGVIDQTIARQLQALLPLEQVRIQDDRHSALRGALALEDGALAHCGTGSFFARQENSAQSFAGGWGPVVDDVASARWAGVRSLSLTLRSVDGLIEGSELTASLLKEFDGAAGIVRFAATASSGELGQIAKTVTQLAQQDDPVAITVLKEGATQIGDYITGMGWRDGDPLCLTGGLGPHYQAWLPATIKDCVRSPIGEPLEGAIDLAREFYQEVISERVLP